MSLWDEFNSAVDRKQAILIIVSVLVATLSTLLFKEFQIFKFEPIIISMTTNALVTVIVSFGLAVILFFSLFELLPKALNVVFEIVFGIIDESVKLIKEKVQQHGLAKVLVILLIIYIILSKLRLIPF